MGDDPDERQETIALVTDELDRMTRLVGDLMLLAKAERPGFLQLEPLDLASLTRELGAKVVGLLIFLGVDWAEDHHDLHVLDAEGRTLAPPAGARGPGRRHARA
jgi:signal transduction histidine kinase